MFKGRILLKGGMEMQKYDGKIMSKSEFMKNSDYGKEEYEGLIVSADTKKGLYNIGVQLSENEILLIDQVADSKVHERYHELIPKIQEIKRQYGAEGNSSSGDFWGGM